MGATAFFSRVSGKRRAAILAPSVRLAPMIPAQRGADHLAVTARMRKGPIGEPEVLVQAYHSEVKGLPTAEEEEAMRRWSNKGPPIPT
jgi:hypothetical protein